MSIVAVRKCWADERESESTLNPRKTIIEAMIFLSFLAQNTANGCGQSERCKNICKSVEYISCMNAAHQSESADERTGGAAHGWRERERKKSGYRNEIRRKKNKIIVEQPYSVCLRGYTFLMCFSHHFARISELGWSWASLEARNGGKKKISVDAIRFEGISHSFRSLSLFFVFFFLLHFVLKRMCAHGVCVFQHVISINMYFLHKFLSAFILPFFTLTLRLLGVLFACESLFFFFISVLSSHFSTTHQTASSCCWKYLQVFRSPCAICVATENDEYLLSSGVCVWCRNEFALTKSINLGAMCVCGGWKDCDGTGQHNATRSQNGVQHGRECAS